MLELLLDDAELALAPPELVELLLLTDEAELALLSDWLDADE